MVGQSLFPRLSAQHHRIGDIVASLKHERQPEKKDQLAAEFESILRQHCEIEDEILYPTLHEAVDDWEDRLVLAGAREDHRIMMRTLSELPHTPTDSEAFGGKVHALDKLWTHHVEDEEYELFAMAGKYLDQNELSSLKRRIRAALAARTSRD